MRERLWKKSESKGWKALGVVIMAAVFICVIMAYSSSLMAADNVIKLKFSSSFFPPEPPNVQAFHCLDLVEKKLKGRVEIKRFVGGTLGGPLEQLGLASTGSVDIISLHVDQYAQQLPLHQILCTEQLVGTEQGLANVTALTYDIAETKALFDAEQKRNKIKILHFFAQGDTGITTRFVPKSMADLKGKKINVMTGYQRKVFNEVGWVPVNVQVPELYESLSRGVIEGIFLTAAAVVPLKFIEIGKAQVVFGPNSMNNSPLAFNLDSWNRLPKDVQQAFIEASWETAQWSVQSTDNFIKGTYEQLEKKGARLVKISKKESDAFFGVLFKYATEEWLAKAKAAGVEKDSATILKYWDQMKWGKWKK